MSRHYLHSLDVTRRRTARSTLSLWLCALLLLCAAPVLHAQAEDARQDPAPSAPAIEMPADAAAAAALDLDEFASNLSKQQPETLFELLRAWGTLLEQQAAAVTAAESAEEGTPERENLANLTTDRDAILDQTKAILAELKSREGVELTPYAQGVADRIQALQDSLTPKTVKATASAEEKEAAAQEVLEQNTTVPQDPSTAHEIGLEVLSARLRPLTKTQVGNDLDGWLSILQAEAIAIRNVEVSALNASDSSEIERFNERLVALTNERGKLIARVNRVIQSFEAKGGDAKDARAYVSSIVTAPSFTGVQAFWIQTRASVTKWVTDPEGGLALLVAVLSFFGILIAFRIVGWIVSGLLAKAMKRIKSSDLLKDFLINSVRKVVSFIGLVVALSQLGVNIGPFLAAIGAAGFVIGFALQGTLSNFASGLMIMLYRPFDIGDIVDAAGVTGSVDSMSLVSTTVKTFDNQSIIIPNSKIWGDVITNVTANSTRRVDMVFGVGYDDDLATAERVFREVVESHELVLKTPAPTIKLHNYNDSSIDFIVRPWAKTADYWTVYWDVHAAMKKRFDEEGLSIPFPQRDVHVYQHPFPEEERDTNGRRAVVGGPTPPLARAGGSADDDEA